METKSTMSIGSIIGLAAIVLVLWGLFNAMGNNEKMQTGLHYLQTGDSHLDYHQLARLDAQHSGIPADLFERQINQESGFNPNAVSPAGAVGIAQIMPDTARGWGVDPWNPVQSLSVAADHMSWYVTHYGGDYAKALAAYNAGTSTLDTAIARYGSNWKVGVPAETQNYIRAIMGV
jgi:soluble lytic murein transglycosylase-like protein